MTTTPDPDTALRDALEARLRAYAPTRLDPATWDRLRDDAVNLVLEAGADPPREEQARKDLEVIADVADHLTRTSETITLESILKETTLAAFDTAQAAAGVADGTRENKRGRLRRLQAASRGLPWRRERRADGARIAALVQPETADRINRLLPGDRMPGRTGPGAVQAALDDARRRRRGIPVPELDPTVWSAARRHARSQGVMIVTRRELDAIATYEVLAEGAPAVQLLVHYRLTRRDLDRALVLADRLPEQPAESTCILLRG